MIKTGINFNAIKDVRIKDQPVFFSNRIKLALPFLIRPSGASNPDHFTRWSDWINFNVSFQSETMDYIMIDYKGSRISGVLVNDSSGILTLKLENGYNLSFDKSAVKIIERRAVEERKSNGNTFFETGNGEKKITILATGGTIASRIDYRTGAVSPVFDPSKIFETKPDIQKKMTIRVRSVLNEMSENMSPDDWIKIANAAREEMKDGRGVVVAHGTDTMSYSASAISFMFSSQVHIHKSYRYCK